jgi:hypothetical protein
VQLPFRWPTRRPPSPDSQPRLLTRGVVFPTGAVAGSSAGPCWLSRALYRCKVLPLAHVASSERRAVVRNLLLAWAPFDQAEYRVVWQGDSALAVAWDRAVVDALIASAPWSGSPTLWPETFLREPPTQDGLRVVACLEGVEAQLWRGTTLHATRWWPRAPDPDDAQGWLRSLGAGADAAPVLPDIAPVAWRRRPWADLQSLDGLSSTMSRLERVTVGAALVGLSALTGAQMHEAWAAYEARQAAQRDHQRLLLEAAPVLAARDRAEVLAREAQGLADQMNSAAPLDVLLHLSDVLPPRGVTLKELDLAWPQLRLALELAPELQRSALVKDLQSGGWLSKVAEVRDISSRGWVVFDAVLVGQRAPVSAARSSIAAAAARQPSAAAVPAPPSGPTGGAAVPAPATATAPTPAPAAVPPAAATVSAPPDVQEPQPRRRGVVPPGSQRTPPPGQKP